MTTDIQDTHPGRKPANHYKEQTQRLLVETGPLAVALIKDHLTGRQKLSPVTADLCKYVTNQNVGMPPQKQVTAGEVVFRVVYESSTIEPSKSEALKQEGGVIALPEGNKPSAVDGEIMSVQEIKGIQESLSKAVHE